MCFLKKERETLKKTQTVYFFRIWIDEMRDSHGWAVTFALPD